MTRPSATCDTSVLVPAVVAWHPRHAAAREAIEARVDSIPAHVFVECYSVLTRLPAPHRLSVEVARHVLDVLDLRLLVLPARGHRAMVTELAEAGISGGAAYDGLVAATARHHGLRLLSADRRARPTYDAMGAGYELL